VAVFDRRGWVRRLVNYQVIGWGRCKLRWCMCLEVASRVRVCSTIKPGDIGGRTRVWYSKARCGVHVPLPVHAGHSLLWHPKIRSRTLDDGSAMEVIHRLGKGV
jgi:hypothetical protein